MPLTIHECETTPHSHPPYVCWPLLKTVMPAHLFLVFLSLILSILYTVIGLSSLKPLLLSFPCSRAFPFVLLPIENEPTQPWRDLDPMYPCNLPSLFLIAVVPLSMILSWFSFCAVSLSLCQSEFLKERGTYTLSMEYFKATFIPEVYIGFLLPLSCCLIILCYSSACINDQLLGNNISINIMAYNRRHLLCHSSCGSGTWVRLSWTLASVFYEVAARCWLELGFS